MKHYKSVEFLSIFWTSNPHAQTWNEKIPLSIEDFLATVLLVVGSTLASDGSERRSIVAETQAGSPCTNAKLPIKDFLSFWDGSASQRVASVTTDPQKWLLTQNKTSNLLLSLSCNQTPIQLSTHHTARTLRFRSRFFLSFHVLQASRLRPTV